MTKSDLLTGTLTSVELAGLMLALLIPPVPHAIGETRNPMSKPVYEVTGHVRLFHADPAGNLKDGREVVVWLVPAQAGQNPLLNTELPHYRVIQHHKMFEPRLLVVPAGSIVEFVNHDPWFHNVFSVSRTRRFDLGLVRSGVQKAVRFDRAGVSYLFCGTSSGNDGGRPSRRFGVLRNIRQGRAHFNRQRASRKILSSRLV